MKLRNRKTGKIVKLAVHQIAGKCYESLAEVNEDWEDVPEEPLVYWFIDEFGLVQQEQEYFYKDNKEAVHDKRKEIGNYFETEEEAEKAVEKLKAWKRLKDKGVRFGKRSHSHYGGEMYWECPNGTGISDKQIWLDLDLLFCPEVKNNVVYRC